MKTNNQNPTISPMPPRAKWRDRHKRLNEVLVSVGWPFLGALPGAYMLWVVAWPVLNSHKFTPQALLALAFIAGGILWVGVFLGAIMASLATITKKLLAADTPLLPASASIPTTAPAKT
jgi:hypothetical protein